MDIGLLSVLRTPVVDFHRVLANDYAKALKEAVDLHGKKEEKKQNFFLSKKRGLEDKLYVGNIHRIESHLYWNDEELADDDQIINVVWVDGPITRDGGACSYGTKDMRDQVMYANTFPQVVGHLFYINTPGGESSARNDYEMMIDDCRKMGKVTVAFVDGLCASSGVNLAARCDRVIVMNPHDEYGCIGSMAAFWATPDGAIDRDGSRYVEIVGDECPEKNDWWREAAKGEYDKLRSLVNKSTQEFHQCVRENRPLVKDWMLTGDIFEAKDLIPALVDEIGDYNRAIECVFALANEEMQAARFAVEEPDEKDGAGEREHNEPEEMTKLNAQQKAAINTSRGDLRMAEDGHVTKEVPGIFGPETVEVATPKNDKEMTDEKKKAAEAEAAEAAEKQKEAAAVAEEGTGEGAGDGAGEGSGEGTGEGAQQGAGEGSGEGFGEGTGEGAQQGAGEGSGEGASEGTGDGAGEGSGEGTGEGTGEGAGDGAGEGTGDQNSEKSIEDAKAEIDRITETLHNAEALVEQKDKEIASLKEELATIKGVVEEREKTITEQTATIENLTSQVAGLKADVKELSGEKTPMVDEQAGIPQGNSTGTPPKQKEQPRWGMTYEEIRAAEKKKRDAAKK